MPAADSPPPDSPAAEGVQTAHPADEYDSPWKEAIEGAFPEFMAFYFPAAHAAIAWEAGHHFLDKELRQVVRDAASGKKFVDVLVRVTGGTPCSACCTFTWRCSPSATRPSPGGCSLTTTV